MTNPDQITPPQLMALAEEVQSLAYAPYSKYSVGAALLTPSGKVFVGCNVENASFGLTVCAERNAIFKAISEGEHEFEAIAIASPSRNGGAPCGACRQVLNEFSTELIIFVRGPEDEIITHKLTDVLPHAFGPQNLNQ